MKLAGHRPLAVVLALLMLGLLSAGTLTSAPAAAAAPLATVSVGTLDPVVGTPGARLHVTGTVLSGRETLRDVRVNLRLSRSRVNSRAELAGVAAGLTTSKDGEVIASQAVPGSLSAGLGATFDLSADLDRLSQLTDFGVYVIAIEVTAAHRSGAGTVAVTRTFLPWVPRKHDFRPTGFTWLWPLVGRPTRLADGTFADDTLAQSLAGGGRLARLSEAGELLGEQVPLSWFVDPDLLETAKTMSEGYTVAGPDNGVIGGGAQQAGSWLEQLRTATATSEVVALPYADPDLTALRRANLVGDIARARDTGTAVATDVLGHAVTSDVVWPGDGFIDGDTLAALRRMGVQAVVLDSRAQPTRLQLNYTPSGRSETTTSSGSITTLVADDGLTRLLAHAGDDPLLAAQRFIAETAMITSELPSTGADRIVLVAPPPDWNPPQEFLDRLVSGTAASSWLSGTGLAGMRSATPGEVERRQVRYPTAQRRHELTAPYLTALHDQHDHIDTFAQVLTQPDAYVPDLDKAVLRLESLWWRGREDRVNRLNVEQSYIAELLGSINVQPGSYTFGSKSGTIPLTISNGIDQEVVVNLRLEPQTPRLRIVEPPEPFRIGPERKRQVGVAATAVASGPVLVNATLHTPGGTALSSQPVQLHIRITQYGTVALAITGAAAGVLFLAALVRLTRRALATRRKEPARPA